MNWQAKNEKALTVGTIEIWDYFFRDLYYLIIETTWTRSIADIFSTDSIIRSTNFIRQSSIRNLSSLTNDMESLSPFSSFLAVMKSFDTTKSFIHLRLF